MKFCRTAILRRGYVHGDRNIYHLSTSSQQTSTVDLCVDVFSASSGQNELPTRCDLKVQPKVPKRSMAPAEFSRETNKESISDKDFSVGSRFHSRSSEASPDEDSDDFAEEVPPPTELPVVANMEAKFIALPADSFVNQVTRKGCQEETRSPSTFPCGTTWIIAYHRKYFALFNLSVSTRGHQSRSPLSSDVGLRPTRRLGDIDLGSR